MTNLRPVLLLGLLFLGYMLWVEWQKDYGPKPAAVENQAPASITQDIPDQPAFDASQADQGVPSALPTTPSTGKG